MGEMGKFGFLIVIGLVLQSHRCLTFDQISINQSKMGLRVFRYLVNSTEIDNIAISPYGIGDLLGILQIGASGRTLQQLTSALQFKSSAVHRNLENVRRRLTELNKDTVIISSGIFTDAKFSLERRFVEWNKIIFHADVKSLDFGSTKQAASSINKWVAKQTEGMIDHLISSDDQDESTVLVGANAVYFKGLWNSQFKRQLTELYKFTTADGNICQVPMMFKTSSFKIGIAATPRNHLRYYVIELSYQGHNSMFIVYPLDRHFHLWDTASQIDVQTILRWQGILRKRQITFMMPKFISDVQTDLIKPLTALGITDMFDPVRAHFPGISKTGPIDVSRLFQRAKIEVNEEGGVYDPILRGPISTKPIIINQTFLYFIQHKPTGAVLFAGRVSNPCITDV